jgi:hypothetical protein
MNKLAGSAGKIATISVIAASLAVVTSLTSVQPSYAYGCGVTIIFPYDNAELSGLKTLHGKATINSGSSGTCSTISGDYLKWYLDGELIGHGNYVMYDFSNIDICLHRLKLVAEFVLVRTGSETSLPVITPVTYNYPSATITVHGPQRADCDPNWRSLYL